MHETLKAFVHWRRLNLSWDQDLADDIDALLKENDRLREALELIEQDTRNCSVIGHPGIECTECRDTNKRAYKALAREE